MHTVEVNQMARNAANTAATRLLCVTSDGRWCEVTCHDGVAVNVFGGSVWPGEMPTVFLRGPVCAQVPVNISLRPDVVAHFAKSVAPLRLPLTELAAAA